MRADEARVLGRVAGRALAGTAAVVREVEDAIVGRATGMAPGGRVVAAAHHAIARPIHAALASALTGVGVAAGAGAALTRPRTARSLAEGAAGAVALGALGGLYGDRLARESSALAIPMQLRGPDGPIETGAAALRAAFPDATGRLAVFVHGLCETEAAWRLFAPADGPADYGARLREDLGHTPLHLRYNSGLRVSENGRTLAALLEEVVGGWPVDVEELVLVGHSMGGLVIRSAAHHADDRGAAWVAALRHVVCLTSPHHGAPMAKAVHAASWALSRVPETRGFAKILELRSDGIRDLRHGCLVDDDWKDRDPGAWGGEQPRDVPFVETAAYYAISAQLAGDRHPAGRLAGDLLVRRRSASGRGPRGRRVPFRIDDGHHAEGLHHFAVLNHPDVYRQMRAWLARTA